LPLFDWGVKTQDEGGEAEGRERGEEGRERETPRGYETRFWKNDDLLTKRWGGPRHSHDPQCEGNEKLRPKKRPLGFAPIERPNLTCTLMLVNMGKLG
jgi:hypothetical protein